MPYTRRVSIACVHNVPRQTQQPTFQPSRPLQPLATTPEACPPTESVHEALEYYIQPVSARQHRSSRRFHVPQPPGSPLGCQPLATSSPPYLPATALFGIFIYLGFKPTASAIQRTFQSCHWWLETSTTAPTTLGLCFLQARVCWWLSPTSRTIIG